MDPPLRLREDWWVFEDLLRVREDWWVFEKTLKVQGRTGGFSKRLLRFKGGQVGFRKKANNPLAFTQKTLIFAQN